MGKLLLYCTKAKPYLVKCGLNTEHTIANTKNKYNIFNYNIPKNLNGKIVAECDFEVEKIFEENGANNFFYTKSLNNDELEEKSCLNLTQFKEYLFKNILMDKNAKGLEMFYRGYAIHIKNLHIFDEPKELINVYKIKNVGGMLFTEPAPPQNMMRVSANYWEYATYEPNDINILISIKSQELCRILNGEQTIIVRKKVLRGMLNNE